MVNDFPTFMRALVTGSYIADMVHGSIKYDGLWMIGSHITSAFTFAIAWWVVSKIAPHPHPEGSSH